MSPESTTKICCLAIDDEPLALQQLASYISNVPYFELVGQCLSAAEAAHYLRKGQRVDAIFIDINMPDLSGMDFVKQLTDPPLVVFTTAYADYAVEGYKVNAIDYILKPFGQKEFDAAAEKVRQQYELLHPVSVVTDETDHTLFLKTDYKIVRVHINSIRFVEAMSEYLRVHIDGEKPVVVLLSMKKMEDYLPKNRFMRIHRSYIVNLQKIKEIVKNHVTMSEGESLPIGELYKDAFMAYVNSRYLAR